jgi:hypothetical protein
MDYMADEEQKRLEGKWFDLPRAGRHTEAVNWAVVGVALGFCVLYAFIQLNLYMHQHGSKHIRRATERIRSSVLTPRSGPTSPIGDKLSTSATEQAPERGVDDVDDTDDDDSRYGLDEDGHSEVESVTVN